MDISPPLGFLTYSPGRDWTTLSAKSTAVARSSPTVMPAMLVSKAPEETAPTIPVKLEVDGSRQPQMPREGLRMYLMGEN